MLVASGGYIDVPKSALGIAMSTECEESRVKGSEKVRPTRISNANPEQLVVHVVAFPS